MISISCYTKEGRSKAVNFMIKLTGGDRPPFLYSNFDLSVTLLYDNAHFLRVILSVAELSVRRGTSRAESNCAMHSWDLLGSTVSLLTQGYYFYGYRPPRFCLAPLDTSLWRSSAPKTIHRIVFSVQNDAAGRSILKIKHTDKSQFINQNLSQ